MLFLEVRTRLRKSKYMEIKNVFGNLKFPLVFLILIIPDFVAADGFTPGKFFQETSIANWVKAVYLFGMGIIGVLAVAVIIFAGIQYTSSVGNPEVISQAKAKIAAAIAGLLLILLSYTILYTLDPRLVKLGFEVEKLDLPEEKIFGKKAPLANCGKDDDCKKICIDSLGEKECKKYRAYCAENKTCQTQELNWKETAEGELILNGLPNGESCKRDSDCRSGICSDYQGKRCTDKLKEGDDCRDDNECESGICNTYFINECAPIGGSRPGEGCNEDRHCASKRCITVGSNECMRDSGNLGEEKCEQESDCRKQSKDNQETLLSCVKDKCQCPQGYKWNKENEKCIK